MKTEIFALLMAAALVALAFPISWWLGGHLLDSYDDWRRDFEKWKRK